MKKRIFAVLLTAVMVLALLPATAFAAGTDQTIMLSTGGLKDTTDCTPNSYVYFGIDGTPLKWRVLDADQAHDQSTPGVFLLSEYLMPISGINFQSAGNSNAWQGSDAQTWCKNFASNSSIFSTWEQSAMLGVAKTDEPEPDLFDLWWGQSILTEDDKMFFLSARELFDYVGNSRWDPRLVAKDSNGYPGIWWLRSPDEDYNNFVGIVSAGGTVGDERVSSSFLARPAFNLDPGSVFFTSAAVGGKDAAGMNDGLAAVGDYDGNEWKLTLLDSSRSFAVSNVIANVSLNTIAFSYANAKTGPNEYVTAVIEDGGTITHYGRILQLDGTENGESGRINLTLPTDVTFSNTAKVYVFNEQYNGDYRTDYAGGMVELSIPTAGSQDGREVELRSTDTHIQWKYTDENDGAWRDLASLADLSGSDGQNGQDGADGQDGREVELQVAGGYIQWRYTGGTWNDLIALSLLKGADGTDGEDGQDGITPQLRINADTNMWEVSYDNGGTWTSLGVKATGSDGQDGADGLTPYIGSNGNWWIGTTDTGIKAAGANGTDGQNGADGLTPYIGANGNWWIGTTDTGIKAAGTNGIDGKNGVNGSNGADGVGIADLVINENGELVVTLTDGTVKNLGKVKGTDGADGVGIAGVAINENGELIVTLTDGTERNAGAVSALTASDSGLKTLVYVSLGIAGVSLAGLIVVLALLLKKRGSLIPQ